ncbi:uncharacterized protein MICPUCDRAFT_38606 [Micromonas pusilla CCMP1545]|uniref:Predicted protein n=1 Tax=Micromonas pusilla (strain CCMP1545) TaxID=564608 RepID=C1MNV0_MICPC|nr:uncharacterized protein MICPUCDRAFT_38606 [Micromonas pusilla CCMP1545]EEH58352.1 predicted protein [Micromonas pusilla CCMP1545]|eukprot:XP_003056707.1 predicted protein [Micromonas pusilla CCMP1545]
MMYNGEEIWDPDERRRIEENKSWKRSDSPTEAWDIDKERDAVMYKRESLERLLSMTRDDVPKVDRAVVCGECKTRVSRRSDEGEKDKAFLHRRQYGEGFVSLGVYKSADVDAVEDSPEDARASQWWPPRRATKCRCRGCGCVLGWRVSDNPQEIITRRLVEKLDGVEPSAAAETSGRGSSSPPSPGLPQFGSPFGAFPGGSPAFSAPPLPPLAPTDAERAAYPGLESGLARSERLGAALIKRENEELPKVRAWASELHAGAYSIRGAPTPCAEEREACVKCYEGHDGDGLKCGREVAAYDRCARAAMEAFASGKTGAAAGATTREAADSSSDDDDAA